MKCIFSPRPFHSPVGFATLVDMLALLLAVVLADPLDLLRGDWQSEVGTVLRVKAEEFFDGYLIADKGKLA